MSMWNFTICYPFNMLQILLHSKCCLTIFVFPTTFLFRLPVEQLSGHILRYCLKIQTCCTAHGYLYGTSPLLRSTNPQTSVSPFLFFKLSSSTILVSSCFCLVTWFSILSGTVQAQNTSCILYRKIPLPCFRNVAPEISIHDFICRSYFFFLRS